MARSANEILSDLIEHACPVNWGDEALIAQLWLEASRATGRDLPEPGSRFNAPWITDAG